MSLHKEKSEAERRGSPSSTEKRCHNCNQTGHLKKDCKEEKNQDKCWNCGKIGHTSRNCKAPRNKPWRGPPSGSAQLSAAVTDMYHQMQGHRDAIAEMSKDLKEAKAASEKKKEDPPPEEEKRGSLEACIRKPIVWTEYDSDSDRLYDYEATAHKVVWTTPHYHGTFRYLIGVGRNSYFPFLRAGFYAFLATASAQVLIRSINNNIQSLMGPVESALTYTPDVVKSMVTTTFRAISTIARLPVPITSTAMFTASLCVSFPWTRFVSWRIDLTERDREAPDSDQRPEATGSGDLVHQDPVEQRAIFRHRNVLVPFPGIYVTREFVRKDWVPLETVTQLTHQGNMVMLSSQDTVRQKIEYSNAHLHAVNNNRAHVLEGDMTNMDASLTAYGLWRQAIQRRIRKDF